MGFTGCYFRCDVSFDFEEQTGTVCLLYKKNNNSCTSYKTINKVSLDKLNNGICPNNVFKQINDFVKKYFSTRTNSGDVYTHYLCSALCVLSTANTNVSITPISEGNTVGVLVGNTAFCSAQYN